MRYIKLLFTLAGLSGCILFFSTYGYFATCNSLYMIAFALSSTALTYALYCLYQHRLTTDIPVKKEVYFYFIDNSPASRDIWVKDINGHRT